MLGLAFLRAILMDMLLKINIVMHSESILRGLVMELTINSQPII